MSTDPAPAPSATAPSLAEGEFRAALDAMFDHVAIGEAIRDEHGTIVDFRMVYLNAASLDGAGRDASELVGRSVLECFPAWAEHGQLERFARVVETGEPYVADRLPYTDVAPDGRPIGGYWSLSAVRFGDGYITASRDVSALVADERARHAAELQAERHRLAVELLQRTALPDRLPDVPGLELAAHYEPAAGAQPVGGDWYDAFLLDGGLLGVVIADVSGHGLDAAAYMLQVRNVVRALAVEHTRPEVVLERANHVVSQLGDQSLFATCCYAVVDPATGAMSWASAGHFAPLLVDDDPAYLPTEVGPPLGVQAGAHFPASTVELAPGDLLVLFTDGLVEDRARPIKACLEDLALASIDARDQTMRDAVDHLVASAGDRSDDLALVCLRRSAPPTT